MFGGSPTTNSSTTTWPVLTPTRSWSSKPCCCLRSILNRTIASTICKSRQHRPVGIVFVRFGVAEIRHESVAHVLGVIPFIVVDDLFRDAMKIGDAVAQVLGVHSASQGGGVHEIAAQQRHLPSVRGLRGWCSRRPDSRSKRLCRFLRGVATAVPQLSQNLAAGEIAVPHSAHVMARRSTAAGAESRAFPVLVSARRTPHTGRPVSLRSRSPTGRDSGVCHNVKCWPGALQRGRRHGRRSARVRQRRGPTCCIRSMRSLRLDAGYSRKFQMSR